MGQQSDRHHEVYQCISRHIPQLHSHGGDVDVHTADADTGNVTVELTGTCTGCGLSPFTADAIQTELPERLDWVTTVSVETGGISPDDAFPAHLTRLSCRDDVTED